MFSRDEVMMVHVHAQDDEKLHIIMVCMQRREMEGGKRTISGKGGSSIRRIASVYLLRLAGRLWAVVLHEQVRDVTVTLSLRREYLLPRACSLYGGSCPLPRAIGSIT